MDFRKVNVICLCLALVFAVSGVALCQAEDESVSEVEGLWNDFLHYTAIGRFDLAEGFAQKIIDSDPDPVVLLELSEDNIKGYKLLIRMQDDSEQLKKVSGEMLKIIEQGRLALSRDSKLIITEIRRLSSTTRARAEAEKRLKNSGEYAVPYMLEALADNERKNEFSNITIALAKMGKDSVRPLVASLQMENSAIKAEVVRALGKIGYPQSLGYLKYVIESDKSDDMRIVAEEAINRINPDAAKLPASELFYDLAQSYYYHTPSLAPKSDIDFGNVWFWDKATKRLVREEVSKDHFNELMAMRNCEWALKADVTNGKVISLWIASFFKAEGAGLVQPKYFGDEHMDAMSYASTAGPEYLHQALERALKDDDAYVALGVVEALITNAGQKSLLYSIGTTQPLVKAMSFKDVKVRYSAAIAIGAAGPSKGFVGSKLIVKNLTEAIGSSATEELGADLADLYALRAISVMYNLAQTENKVVDLSDGLASLVEGTKDSRAQIQAMAAMTLAYLASPDAQRAVADMALSENNALEIRISAFGSLAVSAKHNGKQLTDEQIDAIYSIVGSNESDADLRATAAAAYGALNLPSDRVKDLVFDQSKS